MSVREAEKQLWAMLQKGNLKASGIDRRRGRRVEIPALDWLELVPVLQDVQDPGKGDEVRRRRLVLAKAIGTFEFPPLTSAVASRLRGRSPS